MLRRRCGRDPPPPAPAPLRYLEEMADQVAATGLKVVNGDVVGDDTLFPWEPYAEDWSIDDAVWGYGAPVSALTINDNQIKVTVTPGERWAKPATVTVDPAVPVLHAGCLGDDGCGEEREPCADGAGAGVEGAAGVWVDCGGCAAGCGGGGDRGSGGVCGGGVEGNAGGAGDCGDGEGSGGAS